MTAGSAGAESELKRIYKCSRPNSLETGLCLLEDLRNLFGSTSSFCVKKICNYNFRIFMYWMETVHVQPSLRRPVLLEGNFNCLELKANYRQGEFCMGNSFRK